MVSVASSKTLRPDVVVIENGSKMTGTGRVYYAEAITGPNAADENLTFTLRVTGGITSFTATAIEPRKVAVRWTSDDLSAPVAIERLIDGEWVVVNAAATGGSAEIAVTESGVTTFRATDSTNQLEDETWCALPEDFYTYTALESPNPLGVGVRPLFLAEVVSLASGEIMRYGAATEIKASAYRV